VTDPQSPGPGQVWRGRAQVPAGASDAARPAPDETAWYPYQPPPPGPSRGVRWAVGVGLVSIVALLVAAAMGLSRLPLGGGDSPVPAAAPASPAAPPSPAVPGVGQPVRDGVLEFVVDGVTCGRSTEGNLVLKRQAKGQFCEVRLSVRNTADQSQVFSSRFQKAFDSAGTGHEDDAVAELYLDPQHQPLARKVGAGERMDVVLVYDIPKETSLVRLELHDSLLSNGVTVSLR
jgi:hypothetical protein